MAGHVTVLRISLCTLAAVLGLAALALAHDVHAWRDALATGDGRYATHPAAARWETGTWLPRGVALRTLGAGDDVRLRDAERAFAGAQGTRQDLGGGRGAAERRAAAEVALADVVAGGSSVQASRAGNLLGIMMASGEVDAGPTFDAAVRADPGNVDAKHNLELVLRRLRVIGIREGAGTSVGGDYGQALAGAGAGSPGSGY